jgi:(R,R)-butanediol dehydrogenase / meso-butanediol dehydrogenase / diacetyl reductase
VLTASYLGAHSIGIRDVEPDPPGPGQVQVEVCYVGICGSDLHVLQGDMDHRVQVPAVLGHEMSGVIADLAADVTGWRVGDPIMVVPLVWDGTCAACRAGHFHVCQNLKILGVDRPGALQRFWNVDAKRLVALPTDLRLDHAALVEPVAVAVHDVRRGEVVAGDRVVVLGGGPIGVLISRLVEHAGAEVVVLEVDPHRRASVEALGLSVVDPSAVDAAAWVDTWTGGTGADVVFEASGAAAAALSATDLLKVRGTIVIVGIHPQPRPVDLHRIFLRELRILGARVYERADIERAVELVATGVIPAGRLITRIEPITATADAFAALEGGRAMKILIDCRAEGVAPTT